MCLEKLYSLYYYHALTQYQAHSPFPPPPVLVITWEFGDTFSVLSELLVLLSCLSSPKFLKHASFVVFFKVKASKMCMIQLCLIIDKRPQI